MLGFEFDGSLKPLTRRRIVDRFISPIASTNCILGVVQSSLKSLRGFKGVRNSEGVQGDSQ